MSDKLNNRLPEGERILDFEAAKDMTVEEAARTQEEIKAGITEEDGVLDRYIKQHRDEIEAGKFETQKIQVAEREAALALEKEQAEKDALALAEQQATLQAEYDAMFDDYPEYESEEDRPFRKGKKIIGGFLVLLALAGILWTAYSQFGSGLNLFGKSSSSSTSASKKTSSSSASSSSLDNSALKVFEDFYATFFTDESQTKLKNGTFDQLTNLETALSVLEGTDDYEAAKEKYDKLKAAIEATQNINNQFDKPVLVDGEIDTSATVKSDADLTATATGLSTIDASLAAAVNFGRSQQETGTASVANARTEPAPAAPTAPANTSSVATPVAPSATTGASTPVTLTNGLVLDYGKRVVYGSDQVNLQRDASRVPYNDSAIADAENEAWQFASGVLERIIATSNQRGYFSGNDFILEKVNIINGRGYYNMFRADGTYLFSINAKTGYFVGNGSGHSDNLDF